MKKLEKCPTGIEGIDRLLGGGFPKGSIVLLAGTPGAGKTTFAAKFVYEGIKKYKEPAVYLSFLEPKYDFYRFMGSLGMDFEELEKIGMFKYIEGLQTQTSEGIEEALKEFLESIIAMDARRAVIDSVTAITQIAGLRGARELLRNAIVAGLKPMGVTAILIAELPIGSPVVGFGVEEFVVDGVIILRSMIENGVLIRKMEIRKMRGSEIPRAEVYFDIVPGEGIKAYIPERLREALPPSTEVLYDVPIKELTYLLGQKLSKGSQIAIVAKEACVGLVVALTILLPIVSRYGGKLLVRSFSKPPKLIEHIIHDISKALSIDLSRVKVVLDVIEASSRPLYVLSTRSRESDLEVKPDFIIIDSLNQMPALYGWRDFLALHIDNVLMRRRLGITTFYIYQEREGRPLSIPMDMYDIIIYAKPLIERNCYLIRSFMSKANIDLKPIEVCYSEEGISWRVLR